MSAANLWKSAQVFLPSLNVAATAGVAVVIGSMAYRYLASGPAKKRLAQCALDPEQYTKCKLIKVTPMSHNSAMYSSLSMVLY